MDAIIVPRNSNQARFVAKIGEKSQVPIISLSETSSLLWPSPTPYFIRTEPDSSELEGIASLVKVLGWHDLVVLYQDDTEEEFGSGFIPSLTHTFQQASIKLSYVRAISTSASVSRIKKELRHLRTLQTRVYLVHVTSHDLASRLFSLLHEAGMMSKGTAWIITDALSNSISSLDATTIESMEGVISIRPYIPKSKNLDNFKIKWNQNNCLQENDTVWPLATAVEKIQFQEVKESSKKLNALSPAITQSRISEKGPGLLDEILKTRSPGLSGQFKLKQGKLETRAFEIINILGNGYRTVGYWTPRRGFSRKIQSAAEEDHDVVVNPNNEENVLKPIIWPGETTQKPKGWDIPVMPLKLRVGVPNTTDFMIFVNVLLSSKLETEFVLFLYGRGGTKRTCAHRLIESYRMPELFKHGGLKQLERKYKGVALYFII